MSYRLIFHRVIVALLFISVTLGYCGQMLNVAATIANDGAMQVTGLTLLDKIGYTDGRLRKVADAKDVKLAFLVDRVPINFPALNTTWKPVRQLVLWWGRLVDCPLESGTNVATPGDIMWWVGTAIFLLLLPILAIYLPFWLARDGLRFRR